MAHPLTPTCSLCTGQAFRVNPLRGYTQECTFCGTPLPQPTRLRPVDRAQAKAILANRGGFTAAMQSLKD